MLHDRDTGGQQQRMRRPFAVGRVVDVDRVDADQPGAVVGEPPRTGAGEVGRVLAVPIGAPVPVPAGVQQDRVALYGERGERAYVDAAAA